MITTHSLSDPAVIQALSAGNLIVARTDTIYGILALAEHPAAVEKLYRTKQRNPGKSCIILVDSLSNIPNLTSKQRQQYIKLHTIRPTTVITSVAAHYLPHLKRKDDTLGFRVAKGQLSTLISRTGPLLAPSANPEGLTPARDINEAKAYFGDAVDVYVDDGSVNENTPSRIVRFEDDKLTYIRD